MTGWATTADVLAITGTATTDANLALAQAIVEDHVNRTPEAVGAMRTRDLNNLRKAVAWQAIWLAGQPGLLQRVGTTGISQDGLNVTYSSRADLLLAPLAQRALKNLSWMGSRSIQIRHRAPLPGAGEFPTTAAAFLHSGGDSESAGWEPL
jgi:hypothetical protein